MPLVYGVCWGVWWEDSVKEPEDKEGIERLNLFYKMMTTRHDNTE